MKKIIMHWTLNKKLNFKIKIMIVKMINVLKVIYKQQINKRIKFNWIMNQAFMNQIKNKTNRIEVFKINIYKRNQKDNQ